MVGDNQFVLPFAEIIPCIQEGNNNKARGSYLECVPVGVEDVERDFDVLLDALAPPLKLPTLHTQVQIIARVT